MKKIYFYFDFLSPFSFFAWLAHKEQLKNFNCEIIYRPVLMGKLFSHFNFPGPGEIRVKRNYELKKCFRYASKHKIPFSPPSTFPFNPLAIIRTATLSAAHENQSQVIDCIFKAIWSEGKMLEDPELVQQLFLNNELDAGILENSFAREAKLELKNNINEAIKANIFGVPSFQVDQEYFWGNDSFESLKDYLSGNDNWDKALYNNLINLE